MKNLIRKILEESEFDWTNKAEEYPYVGLRFRHKDSNITFTVTNIEGTVVTVSWIKPRYGGVEERTSDISKVRELIHNGTWVPILNESEFDWTKEVKPMSMGNLYVIDVRRIYIGDFRYLLEDLKELGYDGTEEVPLDACYVYMNYDDGYFSVEWDACNQNNPTYGGDYQMINIERFDEMYYHWKIERDKGVIGESEFDWTEDIKSPVDIALEITDQTVVTPGAFMEHPMIEVPFSDLQYSEPKYFPRFHFDNYIKKHYSEDPTVIDDVWKRWNQEIYSRLSQL